MDSEKEIKVKIKNWLNKRECFHYPYNPMLAKAGMPDRIVTVRLGPKALTVVGLEVKTEQGKVSPIQKLVHKELLAAGWLVGVVRSVEETENFLRENGITLKLKEK